MHEQSWNVNIQKNHDKVQKAVSLFLMLSCSAYYSSLNKVN